MFLGEAIMWALATAITVIVIFWEKQPLSSLGLQRPDWRTIAWGLALAATMIYVVMPLLTEALRAIGIPAFEEGMTRVLAFPLSVRIVAVVTAGVVEDVLFIGYAFTRLAWLTGSNWLAGIMSVAAMALLHLPNWGSGPVLAYLMTGAIATAFFVWRRDLAANMIAHVTVDAMAIVIVPVLLGSRSR
jgi:membrane protease YdiL (CAAX protease family)